uniref:AlNc14C140G7237 protein n=1 Tax=Albugo laibachii Nc14 TaxID=890382 RepID=F0WL50_9STRA|nr:AlNc14C140G7237 [Albugo laibachii Nc14]|eukprot:CCA22010.1 AlNc14C140G7237 [Albugo laibachii Nc14]
MHWTVQMISRTILSRRTFFRAIALDPLVQRRRKLTSEIMSTSRSAAWYAIESAVRYFNRPGREHVSNVGSNTIWKVLYSTSIAHKNVWISRWRH